MKDLSNLNIKINCHSSICINDSIYFDPYNIIKAVHNAKVVFITHSHYDHLDEKSIKNIATNTTKFVCTADSKESLLKLGYQDKNIVVVKVGDTLSLKDIKVKVCAAYNIAKAFHPKQNGWVGYLVTINNVSYYICGDTDATPELQAIKTDVLFAPIGGTYTMTATEAAAVTNIIKPKLVIPVHYNSLVGNKSDEKTFIENLNTNIQYQIKI